MAYITLYRKYRPRSFCDVINQDATIRILKNSIINNKIGHAYIFSGPRGTGKTSVAKIFAKAVNCLSPVDGDVCNKCDVCKCDLENEIDVIEIDAASNNGVDEIREIRNSAKLAPSRLKYKVYIIDEVHMLSTSAFNALLKTLEEPPSHVIFILATTEVNKIPATVLSRCQRFDFKKITKENIKKQIEYILKKEKRKLSEEVIELISEVSDGGLRDAINLTDQLLSVDSDNINCDDIYELIGDVNDEIIYELFNSIIENDIKNSLDIIGNLYDKGKNFVNICDRLQMLNRNIIINNSTSNYFDKDYKKKIEKFNSISIDENEEISSLLFSLSNDLKKTSNQKTIFEINLIKLSLIFSKKDEKPTDVQSSNNQGTNEFIQKNGIKIIKEKIDISYKKNRVNNALAEANKELKKDFIKKYNEIKEYVSSKEYNSLSNLLLKATPEVVSSRNVLFSFKNGFEVVLFDKNIEEIQKFIKFIYKKKYDLVAISIDDWSTIKEKYIEDVKNNIQYEYVSEEKPAGKKKKTTELQNTIENIFGEEYTTIN